MRRRLGGRAVGRLRPGLGASLLASVGMGAGLWGWLQLTGDRPAWLVALVGVALGGLLYWVAALLLKVPGARQLPRLLLAPRWGTSLRPAPGRGGGGAGADGG